MKLKAPNGKEIQGTAEQVGGVAYCTVERSENGEIEIEYEGETKIFWDGQEAMTRGGESVFIDVDGNEWLESELIPESEPGDPEASPAAPSTVTGELDSQQVATILAVLRFYQASGLGDPEKRATWIHDIATDMGDETSMDADGIDDLCEYLNVGDLVEDFCDEPTHDYQMKKAGVQ